VFGFWGIRVLGCIAILVAISRAIQSWRNAMILASADCRAEDIGVHAVVVTELKLRNVSGMYLALTLWTDKTALKIESRQSDDYIKKKTIDLSDLSDA
jgi:hypothetical protein